MDINQLKTLIHVAELGSVSRAAERLNIVQPALSRQIRLLEKELGVYLFERHGRGMVITEVGRRVLDHATRVLAELDAIRLLTSTDAPELHGTVVVGTTPTVAEIATVPLVRKIKLAQPQLAVRFTSAFSGHLVDWLQRGELDLAVTYNPQPLRSLKIVPVMVEELLLVAAGGGLRSAVAVPFAQLARRQLVLPSPRHGLRIIVEACARRAGIELDAGVEADSFGAMIALVREGFGDTVLPLAPIYDLVEAGVLSASPLVNPTPNRELVLVYPADRRVSPATRFVGRTFIEIAARLVEQKVWVGHMLSDSAPGN